MSDRDGRHNAQVGGLVLGLTLVGLYVVLWLSASWIANAHTLQRKAQEYPAAQCKNADNCAEKALKLQARELVTTEATLELAAFQSALNFIGLLGLGVTFFYAHRAWIEARRSADAALRAFEADNRTWVTVKPVMVESVTWENETPRLCIVLEVENVGSQPAFDIQISFEAYLGRGFGAGQSEIDSLVSMELSFARQFPRGETIISGEKLQHRYSTHVQPLPMHELRRGMEGVLDKNIVMTINGVCCVIYRSPSLETLHTSACIAWVVRQDRLDFRPEHGDALTENLRVRSFNTKMT